MNDGGDALECGEKISMIMQLVGWVSAVRTSLKVRMEMSDGEMIGAEGSRAR